MYLVEDTVSERPFALKVVEKNGLRLREYPPVFEEQAVMRALSSRGVGEQTQPPWIAPLMGSFEDSDNFYFLTVCSFEIRNMEGADREGAGILPERGLDGGNEVERHCARAPGAPLVRRAGKIFVALASSLTLLTYSKARRDRVPAQAADRPPRRQAR